MVLTGHYAHFFLSILVSFLHILGFLFPPMLNTKTLDFIIFLRLSMICIPFWRDYGAHVIWELSNFGWQVSNSQVNQHMLSVTKSTSNKSYFAWILFLMSMFCNYWLSLSFGRRHKHSLIICKITLRVWIPRIRTWWHLFFLNREIIQGLWFLFFIEIDLKESMRFFLKPTNLIWIQI